MPTSAKEKLEGFFINLDLSYEEVGENMWLISDQDNGLATVIVYAQDELVTLRAKVMHLPGDRREEFFEELLRLNAGMVHGAYAIEEDSVILMDSLELPTMDLEELQASLDSTGLALAQHLPRLATYRSTK